MDSRLTAHGLHSSRTGSQLARLGFAFALVACAALFTTWVSPPLQARQARTVAAGVYTSAQAQRGAALYKSDCLMCHGEAGVGLVGPAMVGVPFLGGFESQPLADLVDKIQKTMPQTAPGSITLQQSADLTAYILQLRKYPVGNAELKGDLAALKEVTWPPSAAPAPVALAASHDQKFEQIGNMAQLMRGMLFPSSNLLFNVQNTDPGEQKVGWDPSKSAFSWADWGAGIYSGWEMVDFAAITLSEAAPLLLNPRRCENGKPAPVDKADWKAFVQELAAAGRQGLKISQTRDREAMIEYSNTLADACLHCHEVYRDKPGGTEADPSNKAARCF